MLRNFSSLILSICSVCLGLYVLAWIRWGSSKFYQRGDANGVTWKKYIMNFNYFASDVI